jgi:uncharacterized Zn-finger protein
LVIKSTFTATGLIFKQKDHQVEIYRFLFATSTAWILTVLGAFLFTLGAIIVGAIVDDNSVKFTNNILLPLLEGHPRGKRRCPNCGRLIPFDANLCPYCGKKFESSI